MEIYNSVRDLSMHMIGVTKDHPKAMHRAMKYVVSTPTWVWKLKPDRNWDRNNCDLRFKTKGISDLDFAACKSTIRSVTSYYIII